MTDTEAKALALVNDTARAMEGPLTLHPADHVYYTELPKLDVFANALCRAIEREAATEARHAAELREQAERFSEVAKAVLHQMRSNQLMQAHVSPLLTPFIIAKPDPLMEAMVGAWPQYADRMEACNNDAKALCAAIEARGGKIVWEAGE